MKNKTIKLTARYVTFVAIMSATLTVFKLALSFIPNVEVVTLLILCYSSTFGKRYSVPAVMIFCTVETLIYGFNTWVLLYFIYWNLLAIASSIFLKMPRVIIATIIGILFTAMFGVLSTGIDIIFASINGAPTNVLGELFAAYYVKGAWFYLTHILSNCLIIPALYPTLTKLLLRISHKVTYKDKAELNTNINNPQFENELKPQKPNAKILEVVDENLEIKNGNALKNDANEMNLVDFKDINNT